MPRILLVEDDEGISKGLTNELRLAGHNVEVATDGQTALERAVKVKFDLILLDLILPRKDGYSVCRDLRAFGINTPVLALTCRGQESDKVLGFEVGVDDYVTKPFSRLELLARVRALLKRAGGETFEIYQFGDIEVDCTKGEVRRNGKVLETTSTEFKVLATLLRKSGRILSRAQLLDLVWGIEGNSTERVIDYHIMNLRKKIEVDPREPRFLIGVRGLGYRFDGDGKSR